MPDANVTDQIRREINLLFVKVDDPAVRNYLDAAFVALEDEPTSNIDLSPGPDQTIVDFDSPLTMLEDLRSRPGDGVEQLIRCQHALRSAECLWHLREGLHAG